ncbi:tyrosine-type recombinase/integrase [Arthrobacter sp. NPDC093128]|uniref:tyrosine-type recombinase/integrase n=1 Tax=Arthrobacter sp. NPDC093128 TaxID=3154979 RepID=UPI00341D4787
MELRDVDWRSSELVVRGKARRQDRLPLPAEVVEALVAYLSFGRNPGDAVHVFLTCRAPRGPIRADLVGHVVQRACKHASLPNVGAHGLRRALAGKLLRQGVGLVAISQVLRHQDPASTALYAKDCAVSALEQDLADYLQLRRFLGHELAAARRLLPGFVACLEAHGESTVTIQAALDWAPTVHLLHHRHRRSDESGPRLEPLTTARRDLRDVDRIAGGGWSADR